MASTVSRTTPPAGVPYALLLAILQSQFTAAANDLDGILARVQSLDFGAAIPVAGTFTQGSVRFNSAAAVGQPKGWQCTVAGTPGTWVSMGNL